MAFDCFDRGSADEDFCIADAAAEALLPGLDQLGVVSALLICFLRHIACNNEPCRRFGRMISPFLLLVRNVLEYRALIQSTEARAWLAQIVRRTDDNTVRLPNRPQDRIEPAPLFLKKPLSGC